MDENYCKVLSLMREQLIYEVVKKRFSRQSGRILGEYMKCLGKSPRTTTVSILSAFSMALAKNDISSLNIAHALSHLEQLIWQRSTRTSGLTTEQLHLVNDNGFNKFKNKILTHNDSDRTIVKSKFVTPPKIETNRFRTLVESHLFGEEVEPNEDVEVPEKDVSSNDDQAMLVTTNEADNSQNAVCNSVVSEDIVVEDSGVSPDDDSSNCNSTPITEEVSRDVCGIRSFEEVAKECSRTLPDEENDVVVSESCINKLSESKCTRKRARKSSSVSSSGQTRQNKCENVSDCSVQSNAIAECITKARGLCNASKHFLSNDEASKLDLLLHCYRTSSEVQNAVHNTWMAINDLKDLPLEQCPINAREAHRLSVKVLLDLNSRHEPLRELKEALDKV